jgi:TRAP-type C4-dicarboxylate transport system substrate-binding protein
MRTVSRVLFLFLILALAASPALAAKSIKLHHLNQDDPFDNPTGAMATVFKSLVEAGSNGGITVDLPPARRDNGSWSR